MTETPAPYLALPLTRAELRLARRRIARTLARAARALQQARVECKRLGIVIDVPPGAPILQAIEQLASLPARATRKAAPCPSEAK